MSTNDTDALDCIADAPRNAYVLGVDDTGATHVHAPYAGAVWVVADGAVAHRECLDDRPVSEWVAFVADRRGWIDREPVEQSAGLDALATDLAVLGGA